MAVLLPSEGTGMSNDVMTAVFNASIRPAAAKLVLLALEDLWRIASASLIKLAADDGRHAQGKSFKDPGAALDTSLPAIERASRLLREAGGFVMEEEK